MVGYLDSSVLLEHILKGHEGIGHVFSCDSVVSSELLEIECHRVIHRYRLEGLLADEQYVEAVERLEAVLAGVSLISMSSSVKKRASEAFPVVVKTLDALHLASALVFEDACPTVTLLLFSYDKNFNRCGKALGFTAPFALS